jgi:hypothetical protein
MNMANISMARYSVSACLRRVFLALVLTGVCTSAFAVPAELMDQDGKKGGLQDFSGKPVIVFVTSLTEMAELGKWEEALRPKFSSINTIDTQNIWAKEYSLDLFSPCVLIFNADHKMVAKFTGNPKGDVLDEVVAAAAKYFPLKAAPAK